MRKYKNYSDEDIIENAKHVTSLSQLLNVLDLVQAGGNFENMKRNLARLKVDTSHWTGQAWNLDKRLKDYVNYKANRSIKLHLINERGHQCNSCKLSEWMNNPIILELHHKDEDKTNNEENNLELMCPNCHSQTANWRGRKTDIIF